MILARIQTRYLLQKYVSQIPIGSPSKRPLQGKYFKFLDEENKVHQMSKVTWLTQGDRNHEFFPASITSKRHHSCTRQVTLLDSSVSKQVDDIKSQWFRINRFIQYSFSEFSEENSLPKTVR